jgi:Flp pilus assembly pilin Flp
MKSLKRLWSDETGQDLTEYALLVVLVALGAVAAMSSLNEHQPGVLRRRFQPHNLTIGNQRSPRRTSPARARIAVPGRFFFAPRLLNAKRPLAPGGSELRFFACGADGKHSLRTRIARPYRAAFDHGRHCQGRPMKKT